MFVPSVPRLVVALLLVVALSEASWAGNSILIVHTNDRHGYVQAQTDPATGRSFGGVDCETKLLDDIRREALAEGTPLLLLDAGDLFQGTPVVNETQGECMVRFLNELRFHAATLGNHEFDYGQDVLLQRMRESRFLWVSSNVESSRFADLIRPYAIFDLAGTKVAVLGVTSPTTPSISFAANLEGVRFREPSDVLPPLVDELRRRGVRAFILVSHLGYDRDLVLARQYRGLDLIIGGHSHTRIPEPTKIRRTWITQAGGQGRFVGLLRLTLDDRGGVADVTGSLREIDRDRYGVDSSMATLVETYTAELETRLGKVVGTTSARIEKAFTGIDSPMGVICADSLREAAGAEVGLMNAGGVRQSLPAGQVTMRDLMLVSPFSNTVARLRLTGAQIRRLFERSLGGDWQEIPEDVRQTWREQHNGDIAGLVPGKRSVGFLIGAGVEFAFDTSRRPGDRLVSLAVAGAPVDPKRTYVVATNSFLAYGGDGFEEFTQGGAIEDLGLLDVEALRQYFERRPVVSPPEAPSVRNLTVRTAPAAATASSATEGTADR